MSQPAVRRSLGTRLVEAGLIAAAIALVARLGLRALPAVLEPGASWMLPLGLLAGVLCADFASGAAHWFCDSFFSERTRVIGPTLISPFRAHHADPAGIVGHGPLELHGNSCLPVVLVLGIGAALPWEPAGAAGSFACVCLFFMALATMATNQFHQWAHAERPPGPVRWLQRNGLILSPEGHARHHRGGFRRSFCTTTGWLNPLLDRMDLFGRIERRVRSQPRTA
jgi:ubiquitin-conjugating enzyme E2 variant